MAGKIARRSADKNKINKNKYAAGHERGFVLILVVGMLTVLVVLGLSYAEQGRVELRGASNARDLAALDGLAEIGFQFALRALADDRNVRHASGTASHLNTLGGAGWTSRWGFNPDPALGGALPTGADRAPSRSDGYNYQDSWRLLFWNEETIEPVATWTGKAWGYGFKFRPGTDVQAKNSEETQRYPQPASVLLDTVQLQPFARVRKFRVQVGSSFGLVQVGITPKDGGLNLNDVFDPGTVDEHPGVYETLPRGKMDGTIGLGSPYEVSAADARVPTAAPDRRTLEFILGKPPGFVSKNRETGVYYNSYPSSLRLLMAGSAERDNGIYNWRHYFEPYGGQRAYQWIGGLGTAWKLDYPYGGRRLRASTGFLTSSTTGAPTTIWNVAGGDEPNRYGVEPSRHVMWVALKGMAYTADGYYNYPGIGYLVDPAHYGSNEGKDYLWFPSGLGNNDPRLPSPDTATGSTYAHGADLLFHGFGFDRFNAPRAGIDSTGGGDFSQVGYIGAGAYGHPKARTFQLHYLSAVAQGRFWTDLLAGWYFGGAPGYTNYLGATQSSGYNNWAHLGSSYDSIGIGSHWMPPTSHVWLPGFFSKGRISNKDTYTPRGAADNWGYSMIGRDEVSRGMTRWPGNMPPTRMAASYVVPMARWPADFVGQSNAHFTFTNFRLAIRAHGIQENWGDPLAPGTTNADATKNRWYDAVDVNNTNFPVVYGLLNAEKIPSMLNRTAVAPHLHWKARMLDVECRLRRPVKLDGTPEPYDDLKNSWIPVQVGLMEPDGGKAYPGGGWNGDPDSANFNPWIPLRMKLADPDKPWDPVNNVWVEPKLLRDGQPYDALANPLYNTKAFLDEIKNDDAKRFDYIKYPWMPSVRTPVDPAGSKNLMVGMYGWDDPVNAPLLQAQGADWSKYIQDTLGVEKFPYLPIKTYASVDWYEPLPLDANGDAYPSPGWDGYLFVPRWYTGRTVNPRYLKDKRDADKLDNVAAYFTTPGKGPGGAANPMHAAEEPANFWSFAAHDNLEGGLGALTYHRHVDPDRPNVLWGKMDFLTPEPLEYRALNGDLVAYGSQRPGDDVFTDLHVDLSLQEMALNETNQRYASAMARPDSLRNWPDWFAQRKRAIPAEKGGVDRTSRKNAPDPEPNAPFRPSNNNLNGNLIWTDSPAAWVKPAISDGKIYDNFDDRTNSSPNVPTWDEEFTGPPAPAIRRVVRGTKFNRGFWWDWGGTPEPDVKPHPVHGLPNPDYLALYPGLTASRNWADQFRRYVPVEVDRAMSPGDKMVEDPGLGDPATTHTAIDPALPVPRTRVGDETTPVVPGVGKDEAWRITRIGPRYQEIIANELMDYQLNPWWPNPCVAVSELCVPLDKQAYPSEPRARAKIEAQAGMDRWRSYLEHMDGETQTGSRVPKYYAYFNRFWTRTNHKAVRNWGGDPNHFKRPLGEPYRAITINPGAGLPPELINATEGKGMYPPTWQYFGERNPTEATVCDRIKDFPYNVMEDQLGDDWRYIAKSVMLMVEPQMQKAPGRNHPFRNWADFVAFLGHLVYRAPLDPKATPALAAANPKAVRSPLDGVDAWTVCHGGNADARNQGGFFDGSKIRSGSGGTVYADSLRSPIVAREGCWPIAANYGRAPDASADPYYPNPPAAGGWGGAEWKRRWDEIRGRDEAGLRVEHHYISEKAANDVLVSLSNGQIGPIDFDGDGHVTMTRGYGKDITAGYPYKGSAGLENEIANAKPSGDIPQQRTWDEHSGSHHWAQWSLPYGYPWHSQSGADTTVEYEEYDDEPGYDTAFANRDFWDTDGNAQTMSPTNLKLGVTPKPDVRLWRKADRRDLIRNCVTMPIKFHSNTFRVTVAVELTDGKYEEIYATRRYQKTFSRVPDSSASVHGALTGDFVEHASRAMNGVDPELNWLGVR
ncbi:MAG: hypothetical protein L6R28_10680 [Planctomycetes bacterium]|nr:hypothetical protein [Planctomycetota bacterium]